MDLLDGLRADLDAYIRGQQHQHKKASSSTKTRSPRIFSSDSLSSPPLVTQMEWLKPEVIPPQKKTVKFDRVKLTGSRAAVRWAAGSAAGGSQAAAGSWTVLRQDEVDLKGT